VTNAGRRSLWFTIAGGVIVLGLAIFWTVAFVHAVHEWQAIQGEWKTVSVEGDNGFDVGSTWVFYRNEVLDCPAGRCNYSINPLLHTIEWGDPVQRGKTGVRKEYELDGDTLKIWVYRENSENLYVLKRVGPLQP
jgi:hypothetical protein